MKNTVDTPVHVAIGIIRNLNGEILISYRHPGSHQGGLWEFPGGKVESGESVQQALVRELKEELNIVATHLKPVLKTRHRYKDREVLLDVWEIKTFTGCPESNENQPLKWVSPELLNSLPFPRGNVPILSALRLPAYYAILDVPDVNIIQRTLDNMLKSGVTLLQLRCKSLPSDQIAAAIAMVSTWCSSADVSLLINSGINNARQYNTDGVHLTSHDLRSIDTRPDDYKLVAASCHNAEELAHAARIEADFAVLAPVMPTSSHPGRKHLGWRRFAMLVEQADLPVYALGGMKNSDMNRVLEAGGQGISGISLFIPEA